MSSSSESHGTHDLNIAMFAERDAEKVSRERLAELIALPDNAIPAREAREAFRELRSLRPAPTPDAHSEVGEKAEPDWYSVSAGTMHIGLWSDKQHAIAAQKEIQGASVTPLYADPQPAALTAAVVKSEPVAWQGYWPGCGSIDSRTVLTKFQSTMEQWIKDGAEVTPLYA